MLARAVSHSNLGETKQSLLHYVWTAFSIVELGLPGSRDSLDSSVVET